MLYSFRLKLPKAAILKGTKFPVLKPPWEALLKAIGPVLERSGRPVAFSFDNARLC